MYFCTIAWTVLTRVAGGAEMPVPTTDEHLSTGPEYW